MRIGYLGPQKDTVSHNLISASQHPEVVSAKLDKEISLGRVVGPFPFSLLPNFQCHPVGVVPKNTPLTGLGKNPVRSSRTSRFSLRASNFLSFLARRTQDPGKPFAE